MLRQKVGIVIAALLSAAAPVTSQTRKLDLPTVPERTNFEETSKYEGERYYPIVKTLR